MAFTTVTLEGAFKNEDGSTPTGQLTFTLTGPMTNGNVAVSPAPITVALTNGAFSQTLYANDDPTTEPQGTWYGVTEQIEGCQPRDYYISIPHAAAGGKAQLAELVPGEAGWT